nr:MAG TPA: hypothetical protein [Caudoviricetes sp.]
MNWISRKHCHRLMIECLHLTDAGTFKIAC